MKQTVSGMTPIENRAALSLAAIFSLRMLGLFMIYPVFSLYALEHLEGATPASIGMALGAYGLTQALFQIPFGMLSDRWGRKPLIAAGLIMFAIGSVVAALSDSIQGVVIGRILQGAGAIGSTILALAADLTREQNRTRAMATIGMTIGMSFALAVVLGPILNNWIGVPGIFGLTAVLAMGGLLVLKYIVPTPVLSRMHRDAEAVPELFKRVLSDGQLLRLDYGIMTLHMILTASFIVLPLALRDVAGLDAQNQWQLYLPVLLIAVVIMLPFIILAEKYRQMKPVFLGAILVLCGAEFALGLWHDSLWSVAVFLTLFFAAFTLMEASLPSLISKFSPAASKGTAMGVYSTSQLFAIFVVGGLGDWIYHHFEISGVFVFTGFAALLWFVVALSMPKPKFLSSHLLNLGELEPAQVRQMSEKLAAIPGVAEVAIIPEEGVAYLKVDSQIFDESALQPGS